MGDEKRNDQDILDDDFYNNMSTLDSEYIEERLQVVHLTTAIFLLFLGAHLEYLK